MFTLFYDMHSGGKLKEKHQYIYIEAPKKEAEIIFCNIYHRNPYYVTCSCCGQDYCSYENESLEELSACYRHCGYKRHEKTGNLIHDLDTAKISTQEHFAQNNVRMICEAEITDEMRRNNSLFDLEEDWEDN